MRRLKHLRLPLIPEADMAVFKAAYVAGDPFDETSGTGAHFSSGMRKMVLTSYRRWLGFLTHDELAATPADRITPERVRTYVKSLSADMQPVSIAICLEGLFYFAKFAAPTGDWKWLMSIARRLRAGARPKDRFQGLIPGWSTLDYGIRTMDAALALPATGRREREILFRDGLLLAMLSLWPIRRRSIAALTIDGHLEFDGAGANILLNPQDTKSQRAESCRLHDHLVRYLKYYLNEVRPRFRGSDKHNALWASCKGCPLTAGRLYDIVPQHTARGFDKAMGLHDFRRAAATFLATEAPHLIGLIPGILQHSRPEVSEQHYNLARTIGASRRHLANLEQARSELRLFATIVR